MTPELYIWNIAATITLGVVVVCLNTFTNSRISKISAETSRLVSTNSITNANYLEFIKMRSKVYEDVIYKTTRLKNNLSDLMFEMHIYREDNSDRDLSSQETRFMVKSFTKNNNDDINDVRALRNVMSAFGEAQIIQLVDELMNEIDTFTLNFRYDSNDYPGDILDEARENLYNINSLLSKLVQAIRKDLSVDENYKRVAEETE